MGALGSIRDWVGGLISVIAGAFFAGMGAIQAAPDRFNFMTPEGRKHLTIVAVWTALPVIFAYLQRRPLPGVNEPDTVTTTRQTIDQISPTRAVVSTVETVKTEPKEPPK